MDTRHLNVFYDMRGFSEESAIDIRDPRFNKRRLSTRRKNLDHEIEQIKQAEHYVFAQGPLPTSLSAEDAATLSDLQAQETPEGIDPFTPEGQETLFRRRDAGLYGQMLLWLLAPGTRALRMQSLEDDLQSAALHRKVLRQQKLATIAKQTGHPIDPACYTVLLQKRAFRSSLDTSRGRAELISKCATKAAGIKNVEDLPPLLTVIVEGRQAVRALIKRHLSLVAFTAMDLSIAQMPLKEKITTGYEGLAHAIRYYDTDHNLKISNFAIASIAGSIRRAASVRWAQELHCSRGQLERSISMHRKVSLLEQELGRTPTIAEIAERLHMRVSTIEFYRSLMEPKVPLLDAPSKAHYDNREADRNTADFFSEVLPKLFKVVGLSQREQQVLEGLFGIGVSEQSREELASTLHLPVSTIRRVERTAKQKVRDSPQAAEILSGYLKPS